MKDYMIAGFYLLIENRACGDMKFSNILYYLVSDPLVKMYKAG